MKKHTRRRLGGSRSDSRNDVGSPARSKSKTKKNDKEFLEEGASAETIDDQLQFYSDEKAASKSSARAEFLEDSKAVSPAHKEIPAVLEVMPEPPYKKLSKTRKKPIALEASAASASAEKPKRVNKSRKKKEEEEEEEEDEDDGETQCEVDGRTIACKKNNKRERLLWECFKGEREILDEEIGKSFSCEPIKIRGMVDRFTLAEPTLRSSVVQIGGQGNNYDYTFMRGSLPVNIELKTNKSSTKEAALSRVPWTGYGQLIQIFVNVKDEKYKPLFQSFDMDGMVRHWFDTVIMPEIVPKYRIEGPITYESYCKLSFNTSKKAETLFEDASLPAGTIALFKHFHENRTKADNKYRGDLWKSFTRMWMETHQFDPSLVLELIKSTLNKKDIWVCTTKLDAYVIPGPKCANALPDFKGVKHNKEASILIYQLTLIDGTTDEEYKVEFKFRFYWKNGGQGVHNLCLQIG
jgi:hypothetical protein